jgi:N-acetylglucosamine kinase-like BadF-type ATPase
VPENAAWSIDCLTTATGTEPIVVEDVDIAMEAAFHGGPGALVISGTGSQIMARRADGATITTGGYGELLSDEGSGAWIGMQAVRQALAMYDFKTVSPLLAALMQEWQCEKFTDFIAAANPPPMPNFSGLVQLVCRLAEAGDLTAVSILESAGQELASLVKLALLRLEVDTLRVACTGSILENVPMVRQAMVCALPGITILDGVVDPVEGALWMALTNLKLDKHK